MNPQTQLSVVIVAPPDMESVDVTAFFHRLRSDPRDIMPSCRMSDYSEWIDRNGNVVGRSYPGWRHPGGAEAWFLSPNVGK